MGNWMPGEPSNTKFDGKAFSSVDGTEACVYLHGSGEQAQRGRWGDLPCPEKMAFVCQVPLDGVTQAAIRAARESAEHNGLPPGSEYKGSNSWYSWISKWFFRLLLVGGAGCVLMYAQAEGHLEGALEAVSEVATAVGEKFS